MPDWSYRTLFRPLLFRLPAAWARRITLGNLRLLGSTPFGLLLIDLLGHMRADPRLRVEVAGHVWPTRIGFGWRVDPQAEATKALARFGVGFLEIGPVSRVKHENQPTWDRANCGVRYSGESSVPLDGLAMPSCDVLVRLTSDVAPAEIREVLGERVAGISLTTLSTAIAERRPLDSWREELLASVASAQGLPVFVVVPPEAAVAEWELYLRSAARCGIAGWLVDGTAVADGDEVAAECVRKRTVAAVRFLVGIDLLPIIASGGIHEPGDALELLAAGADLLLLDTGLIYSGPGLPKRMNQALLSASVRAPSLQADAPLRQSWFWLLLMGLGLTSGGVLALAIALTRVVLPYDEWFLGLKRAQITALNPHLLSFLQHDRVTLAGVMVSLGILYVSTAWHAVRQGAHWAWVAMLSSAFVGFLSFFSFLGFGYFDPFHAFVTAVLFQFLLLAAYSPLGALALQDRPLLRENQAWRRSQWGQLLLVVLAAGLLGAGAVISWVGCTSVFVPEDLAFLGVHSHALHGYDPELVPLVAHDRATLGGMLLASGTMLLLTALWGVQGGARWLWRSLLAAGCAGFLPAIVVHYAVGYTSPVHLAPAFLGLFVCAAALGLLYPALCQRDHENERAWACWRRDNSYAAHVLPDRVASSGELRYPS